MGVGGGAKLLGPRGRLENMALNSIQTLKTGVLANDPKLIGRAVDSLRLQGMTYRDCYRIALAANPSLQESDWEDMMQAADEADSD